MPVAKNTPGRSTLIAKNVGCTLEAEGPIDPIAGQPDALETLLSYLIHACPSSDAYSRWSMAAIVAATPNAGLRAPEMALKKYDLKRVPPWDR